MKHNPVDTETIPEVRAYEEAKEMLETYKGNHQRVFETYDRLLEDVNTKMEAADKIIRSKSVSCSDWVLYQFQRKDDAESLFNAIGITKFLELGGSTTTKTVYKIERASLDAARARGDITEELYNDVVEQSPRYHAPRPKG